MTACCVSGYRPLRDIRPDEATWPPVLEPAGSWEICDCAEGNVVRRMLGASRRLDEGAHDPLTGVTIDICDEPCPPPRCSTYVDAIPAASIEWSDRWHTYLCAECGALLAEEKE